MLAIGMEVERVVLLELVGNHRVWAGRKAFPSISNTEIFVGSTEL